MKYILLIGLTTFIFAAEFPVAILEHSNQNEKQVASVRVLNKTKNSTQKEWFVCFDGKKIGRITSKGKKISGKIPTMGKPTSEFGGVSGKAVYRPLVLTPTDNCQDSEAWKVLDKTKIKLDPPLKFLKEEIAKRPTLEQLVQEGAVEGDRKVVYAYAIGSAKIIKAYRSKSGAELYQLSTESEGAIRLEMIGRNANGSFKYIGEGLSLIDAGDYDDKGNSKLVFMYTDGSNSDGYLVYDSNFNNVMEFFWSYH